MLFVSGDSQFFDITHKVYEFFTESYEISSDVEIFATNLSDENALGFTEVNGDEQFVQVHNELTKEEHVKTILHELVHVVQNEQGLIDDDERELEAYRLEEVLYNNYCASEQTVTTPLDLPTVQPYIGHMGGKATTRPHFTSLTSLLMRKIEQQMNDAVANNKNWQSANTSVHFNEENGVSIVRLHGNKIAEIGDDYLQIFDGGWQTVTTKSRLNALIDRFCNAVTDGVFQKDYQWYIRDNNVTRDFDNGYIFA